MLERTTCQTKRQPKEAAALVCLYPEFEWPFNARLRVCPRLFPTSTAHVKGAGKTLGDCRGVRDVCFLVSVRNERIKGIPWEWGFLEPTVMYPDSRYPTKNTSPYKAAAGQYEKKLP